MIYFDDWLLKKDEGPVIARQYDNLTRRLEILGDIPEGWSWTLLVQADKHLDLIALTPMEGGLGVDLTAEMLALSGYYTVQLKGVRGELVRHTNQVRIFIPDSLSGDANWPEVPSEFSQVEANIRVLGAHPPVPGDKGYWLVWDLERGEYVTSGLPLPDVSVGPAGKAATIKVGETVTGDPGTQAAVENTGTENAAVLRFTIPRGAVGPTGATPAISVEVTGLPAGAAPTAEVSGTPEAPVIALGIPAGRQGDPGTPGTNGTDGRTPNITIGQVETLPAGSDVTATITGETPNLVLNLGVPQGSAGDGVPPTDGVPENYVLTPAGWAALAVGGENWQTILDITTDKEIAAVSQSGLSLHEIEAYVRFETALEAQSNLYLTNKSSEDIYGDPRMYISVQNRPGTAFLAQKVVKPWLWEQKSSFSNYLKGPITTAAFVDGFISQIGIHGDLLDIPEITEFSLVFQSGTFPIGTRIFVRGR